MAKPFIKWAGGKRQLMDEILARLPSGFGENKFRKYAEPFVGGGAVLFKMFELNRIDEAVISDYNSDLTLTYEVIKTEIELIIEELSALQHEYNACDYQDRKIQYFDIRNKFNARVNDVKNSLSRKQKIIHASQFIYLNKVGFNGLFRVNSKGEFNVPPSDLKDKVMFEEQNLRDVSEILEEVTILTGDFSECVKLIDKSTFVYFDPPYKPITKTSFTAYANSNFNDTQQKRLAEFCTELSKQKVNVMVSNSNPEPKNLLQISTFFRELFPETNGFKILEVNAIRSINSKGSGRGKVSELIITNY